MSLIEETVGCFTVFCWLKRSWQLGLWPGKAFRIWILHWTVLCFVLAGSGCVTRQLLVRLRHPPTAFFSGSKSAVLKLILAFDTISEFFGVSTAADYSALPCKPTRIHLNLCGSCLHLCWFAVACAHTAFWESGSFVAAVLVFFEPH